MNDTRKHAFHPQISLQFVLRMVFFHEHTTPLIKDAIPWWACEWRPVGNDATLQKTVPLWILL